MSVVAVDCCLHPTFRLSSIVPVKLIVIFNILLLLLLSSSLSDQSLSLVSIFSFVVASIIIILLLAVTFGIIAATGHDDNIVVLWARGEGLFVGR